MLNEEELNYLKQIYKGRYVKDITIMINKKFSANHKTTEIEHYKRRYGLKSGIDCRFKKGAIPYNKNIKGSTKRNAGCFKKGHRPQNYKPVGTEVFKRGYWVVKICDPNVWEFKHKLIWEKHHGEIPKGYMVTFLDGDTNNLDISNLALISKNENKIMNVKKLRKSDAELTKVGVNIAKVIAKTNELERKKDK
jgi:hypothetical protein